MKKVFVGLFLFSVMGIHGCKSTQVTDYNKDKKEDSYTQTDGAGTKKETFYNEDGSVNKTVEWTFDYSIHSTKKSSLIETAEVETVSKMPSWLKTVIGWIIGCLIVLSVLGYVFMRIKKRGLLI